MSRLACPSCGEVYPAANVNVALGVAACARGGEVHDLSARPALTNRSPADGAGVREDGDRLLLPWLSIPTALFLGLFCMVWDGILVSMVGAAVAQGQYEIVLAGSVHGLVGAGLTYLFVCTVVNSTAVTVLPDRLEVSHGPLPWPFQPAADRADVRQIYVIEDRGSKGRRSYSVHAQLANGHAVQLLRGLLTPGRARFVEEWLERKLALVDRPVGGEHA
jgi:hypothetical protein